MRYLEVLAAAQRDERRRAMERATAENEGDGRCSCGAPGEVKVSRGWHARAGLPAWEWACTEHARDGVSAAGMPARLNEIQRLVLARLGDVVTEDTRAALSAHTQPRALTYRALAELEDRSSELARRAEDDDAEAMADWTLYELAIQYMRLRHVTCETSAERQALADDIERLAAEVVMERLRE